VLSANGEVNALFSNTVYSPTDKQRIRDLLVEFDIYSVNTHGAVRRKNSNPPRWAWLRKNRGSCDGEPADETGTRMAAQVIKDLNADIIGIVEEEDRPALVRVNEELPGGLYRYVMLVDGNDERGIDAGIMTRQLRD
jgi:hypothetical protein